VELRLSCRLIARHTRDPIMKRAAAILLALALSGAAYAQTTKSNDDPAASSASRKTDTTGMTPSKSGSGTSTSGGSDANGDQGRDKMPDSNKSVKPLDQQHKPNQ
jgi:hypothetical protein